MAALGAIFDKYLLVMTEITDFKMINVKLSNELLAENQCIEALEAYSHHADIIMTGMPMCSFAEAVSDSWSAGDQPAEHDAATETAMVKIINSKLNVTMMPQEISVAHWLSTKRKTGGD